MGSYAGMHTALEVIIFTPVELEESKVWLMKFDRILSPFKIVILLCHRLISNFILFISHFFLICVLFFPQVTLTKMVVKPEQERVRNLLTDTVTLLCKNGLTYGKEMKVQGLLGITLDEDEVFVVHIDEKFEDLLAGGKDLPTIDFPAGLELDNNKDSESVSSKKRRKRKGSRDSENGSVSGNATPSKRNRDADSQDSMEVRVKQEQPEDVICLEDDGPNIKPDPLRNTSFSASSFGQLEQNTQPYITGMVQSTAQSVTSQMSDNSNASWDGSSSSQLPQLTPYKGAAGMPGGTPGSGGASWNPGDPSVGGKHFLIFSFESYSCFDLVK